VSIDAALGNREPVGVSHKVAALDGTAHTAWNGAYTAPQLRAVPLGLGLMNAENNPGLASQPRATAGLAKLALPAPWAGLGPPLSGLHPPYYDAGRRARTTHCLIKPPIFDIGAFPRQAVPLPKMLANSRVEPRAGKAVRSKLHCYLGASTRSSKVFAAIGTLTPKGSRYASPGCNPG
jgi:hypothetical protein